MVHALVPFAIRGAIWYQGESNRGEGMLYLQKMRALIGGWRKVWDQGEFPFLFVQLAPWRYPGDQPLALPEIWEAQAAALRAIPNTGMAVTTDIGNLADIHPKNKQDVGLRLALWALAKTYGQDDLPHSGPLYKSMEAEDGRIRVRFEHAEGLKSRDGQSLSWFQIAGADGKFVDAEAKVDGETVVVRSDDVQEPKAVRFGWHQEAEPNLSNAAGLPASPFRASLQDE
jgi:sialate O-acetylesterase